MLLVLTAVKQCPKLALYACNACVCARSPLGKSAAQRPLAALPLASPLYLGFLISAHHIPSLQSRTHPVAIPSPSRPLLIAMPLQPTVLWAQRADRLLLTIDLQACKDPQIR